MEIIESSFNESSLVTQSVESISNPDIFLCPESSEEGIMKLNDEIMKETCIYQNEYKKIKLKLRDTEDYTIERNIEKYKFEDQYRALEDIDTRMKSDINFSYNMIDSMQKETEFLRNEVCKLAQFHVDLKSKTDQNEIELQSSTTIAENNWDTIHDYSKSLKELKNANEKTNFKIMEVKKDIEAKIPHIKRIIRKCESLQTSLQCYELKISEIKSTQNTKVANLKFTQDLLNKELAQKDKLKREYEALKEKVRNLKVECHNRIKVHNENTLAGRQRIDELKKELQKYKCFDNSYTQTNEGGVKDQTNDTISDINQTLMYFSISKH